jgi:glycosyltransferase involved in cell wall biosynthesis
MKVLFIEDNMTFGGTQMWVYDALKYFKEKINISLLVPKGSCLDKRVKEDSIDKYTYGYSSIARKNIKDQQIWEKALASTSIAVCTVNPPRGNYHCMQFAAKCIDNLNLSTNLIAKTGSVMPGYQKEYYIPRKKRINPIICTNSTVKQYLITEKAIPEQRISVIYQGIDLSKYTFAKSVDSINDKLNKNIVFGFIGCLENRKGIIPLIKVFNSIIKQGHNNIKLIIVGEGSKRHELCKLVNVYNLSGYISIEPFSNNIQDVYTKIDALVFPSICQEGLPNVILEAIAMNKLVIASNIGAVSEIISHLNTGLLFSPENWDSLKQHIISILEGNININNILVKQRLLVSKNYSRITQFRKYMNFFRRHISKRNQVIGGELA